MILGGAPMNPGPDIVQRHRLSIQALMSILACAKSELLTGGTIET